MLYREPLPQGCPPSEADEIRSPRVVYRLVRSNPPTVDDFKSQRAEKPCQIFRNVTECQARGLSVRTELDAAIDLLKLRKMRGRKLCTVKMDLGAGRIMQTGKDPHHSTWWPLASFDILANCSLVTA